MLIIYKNSNEFKGKAYLIFRKSFTNNIDINYKYIKHLKKLRHLGMYNSNLNSVIQSWVISLRSEAISNQNSTSLQHIFIIKIIKILGYKI